MDEIRYRSILQNQRISSLGSGTTNNAKKQENSDFDLILKQKLNSIQISKHASMRIEQRGIKLDDTLMTKMNDAVTKANLKGIKDMVVINENKAFIINVPSKTLITAMNNEEVKDNIFTNIDGAVMI